MGRRSFLKAFFNWVTLYWSSGLFLSGCGQYISPTGQTTTQQNGGNCSQSGTSAAIAANHGHSLTVPKGDVSAGVTKTYDMTGSSGHSHSVTLTSADFSNLQSNQTVQIASSLGSGHSHIVTVSCI